MSYEFIDNVSPPYTWLTCRWKTCDMHHHLAIRCLCMLITSDNIKCTITVPQANPTHTLTRTCASVNCSRTHSYGIYVGVEMGPGVLYFLSGSANVRAVVCVLGIHVVKWTIRMNINTRFATRTTTANYSEVERNNSQQHRLELGFCVCAVPVNGWHWCPFTLTARIFPRIEDESTTRWSQFGAMNQTQVSVRFNTKCRDIIHFWPGEFEWYPFCLLQLHVTCSCVNVVDDIEEFLFFFSFVVVGVVIVFLVSWSRLNALGLTYAMQFVVAERFTEIKFCFQTHTDVDRERTVDDASSPAEQIWLHRENWRQTILWKENFFLLPNTKRTKEKRKKKTKTKNFYYFHTTSHHLRERTFRILYALRSTWTWAMEEREIIYYYFLRRETCAGCKMHTPYTHTMTLAHTAEFQTFIGAKMKIEVETVQNIKFDLNHGWMRHSIDFPTCKIVFRMSNSQLKTR